MFLVDLNVTIIGTVRGLSKGQKDIDLGGSRKCKAQVFVLVLVINL